MLRSTWHVCASPPLRRRQRPAVAA
jgi:hypothetical protein